jgi:hypothetical protein
MDVFTFTKFGCTPFPQVTSNPHLLLSNFLATAACAAEHLFRSLHEATEWQCTSSYAVTVLLFGNDRGSLSGSSPHLYSDTWPAWNAPEGSARGAATDFHVIFLSLVSILLYIGKPTMGNLLVTILLHNNPLHPSFAHPRKQLCAQLSLPSFRSWVYIYCRLF